MSTTFSTTATTDVDHGPGRDDCPPHVLEGGPGQPASPPPSQPPSWPLSPAPPTCRLPSTARRSPCSASPR